jgi:hypothetical protein
MKETRKAKSKASKEAGGMAQVVERLASPMFKPQYCQEKEINNKINN